MATDDILEVPPSILVPTEIQIILPTILDGDEVSYPVRSILKFSNATVTDDEANDTTIIQF